MRALTVRGITVRFGGLAALRDVDLEVDTGERRAVVGPNGAGKSTLFNVIGGQLRSSRGTVELLGSDITGLSSQRRARLGLGRTWQITNLFDPLSVEETMKLAVTATYPERKVFWRPLNSLSPVRARTEELLETWGLTEVRDFPVQDLSYGQQRLLEIAVAMAGQPKVVLLDEPTAGLAPADAQRMTEIVTSLPDTVTLLMIEHDMAVAFAIAKTMTVLAQGQVLASGPVEEIRRHHEVIDTYLGTGSHAQS